MTDLWGNPSPEDIFGTPEELAWDAGIEPVPEEVEKGYWPDRPTPLKQLRALCFGHFHHTTVGTPFRYSNEWIRLDESRSTSADRWGSMQMRNQTIRLFCPECGRYTWHAPKRWIEVDE